MAGAPSAWTQFFADLKRPRVFPVAFACLAAAFVVLQLADQLFRGPTWAIVFAQPFFPAAILPGSLPERMEALR